jgi:hypothetical protein
MELCTLAAQEQDSKKLVELTNEILRLLDEQRENTHPSSPPSNPVERP